MKYSFQYIHANTGWWNSEVRADRNCVLLKQACRTTLVPPCLNSDVQGLQYFLLPIARAKRTSQLVPTWTSFNDCEERTAPLAGTTRTRLLVTIRRFMGGFTIGEISRLESSRRFLALSTRHIGASEWMNCD